MEIFIMNRFVYRRIIRPLAAVLDFLCEIIIGIVGWLFISFLIIMVIRNEAMYGIWMSWGTYVYAIGVIILSLRNIFHQFKWYIAKHPLRIECPKCHSEVKLSRYGEERFLNAPVVLYLETIRFQLIRIKQYFYQIAYRPYLQLECTECGEKQVICPYCHEVISQELVECHYNKPTKCPHCGKKIYTPLPLQESEDLIEISALAK